MNIQTDTRKNPKKCLTWHFVRPDSTGHAYFGNALSSVDFREYVGPQKKGGGGGTVVRGYHPCAVLIKRTHSNLLYSPLELFLFFFFFFEPD